MLRLIGLFCVLIVTWLLMSGHYEPLIIGFGVVSCIAIILIVRRMDIVDKEGFPLRRILYIPLYWLWLIWEIIKANWDVAKRCVMPGSTIDPLVITVPSTQKTDLGVATYANSITLTPGTISMRTYSNEIEVHALTKEAAEGVETGEMDRRVTQTGIGE